MKLTQDLRYAFRQLRRNPGFALTAILTLALGIGATTAVFSVVEQMLLTKFPYRDADRIVALETLLHRQAASESATSQVVTTRTCGPTPPLQPSLITRQRDGRAASGPRDLYA